jgi:hypothetical protein
MKKESSHYNQKPGDVKASYLAQYSSVWEELLVNMSGTTMISYCTTRRNFNSSITGKKYQISTKEILTM